MWNPVQTCHITLGCGKAISEKWWNGIVYAKQNHEAAARSKDVQKYFCTNQYLTVASINNILRTMDQNDSLKKE